LKKGDISRVLFAANYDPLERSVDWWSALGDYFCGDQREAAQKVPAVEDAGQKRGAFFWAL
jgi:hypothetical protein